MSKTENSKSGLSIQQKCGLALAAAVAASSINANDGQHEATDRMSNSREFNSDQKAETILKKSLFDKLNDEGLLKWELISNDGQDSGRGGCRKTT